MSAGASEVAGRRPWPAGAVATVGRFARRVEAWPPRLVVPVAVVVQWLIVLGVALVVRHNAWVYYQGGDQLWYYSLARQIAHGQLWQTPVGYLWSFILAPFAGVAGADLVSAFPAIILFDVVLLLPIVLLAVYGIASRLGGRLFGYWALLLWLVLPFVGIRYTNTGYHQRYTELLLPQGFGLTAMADFPTMVAVAATAYFAVRALLDERPSLVDGAAIGVAGGIAVALKPSASLVLLGPPLALLVARRFRVLAASVGGFVPWLVTLAVWKARGLGNLPILSGAGRPTGVAATVPLAGLNVGKYLHELNWHRLMVNIDLLREYFWSGHFAVWLLLAGLVAIGRRSPRVFVLAAGMVLPFVIVKGSYLQSSFQDGSLFRLLMPIYPVFVLGIACLPLLLPHAPARLRPPAPTPRRPARTRLAVVGAAVLLGALVPLAVTAVAATGPGGAQAAFLDANQMPIPVNIHLGLHARVHNGTVLLQWRAQHPLGGPVFYRITRDRPSPGDGLTCTQGTGAVQCSLKTTEIAVTGGPARYDKPPPGTWVYRVGVAANWLNSPQYGDVYFASEPLLVHVP